MARQFTGKVALVTGAGSGIGRATAVAFAREGARVIAVDLSSADGEATVRTIRDAGGEATFVAADVSRARDAERMVASAVDAYGGLDYAHNNAGIDGEFATIVDCTEENWDRVLAVNLKSVWLGLKYEIPAMRRRGGGAIVNTGSVASLVAYRTMGHYVASKHGVVGITKTAALECSRIGIRVNAVCPGVIKTAMIDAFVSGNPDVEAQMVGMEPVGRMGTPEEVANAVVWLCSDAASFVTGAVLTVDGGIASQSGSFPPVPEP